MTNSDLREPSSGPAGAVAALTSHAPEPVRVRDLDTRLILAFRAVAVEGTFGRAARRLGYTQSAVSQQIAALEKVVGAPLFERRGGPRPVALTSLGGVLLRRAHEMLGVLESMAMDVAHFRSGDLGRIDVGTIQSISTALLPTILRRLRAERPGLDMRLQEHYEETELVEGVTGGELDVTFLVNGNAPRLKRIDVLTDPFVVVARAADVGPGPIPVSRLAEGPLIGQVASTYQNELDGMLAAAGCDPDYVFRSADNGVVVSMVRAGLGLAILPRLALLNELDDPRLAIRTLNPPIPARVIRLAWRRDRALSPAAERFRDIAIDVAAELGHRHPVLAP
jgi:DNA-binding transcriptional LysR family regulator